MRASGKVGVAKVVIRSKEQLVALRPIGEVLGMTTMNFHDEVVDAEGLDEVPAADEVQTTDRELEIAQQLVDSLAEPFEPERYHDTYREQVLDLIERKAAGEEIAVQPAAEEAAPVPDLMSALKASLDAVRERTGDEGEDGAAAKTKRKAPAKKSGASGGSRAKAKK
jgi:DNA end-binding protein Ku